MAHGHLKYWPPFWAQVTFLVTEDPSRGQGRARREVLSPLRFEPYEVVALASGGEVIVTKDQHIQDVAAIVGDSMADVVSKCREQRDQCFQLGTEGTGDTAFLLLIGEREWLPLLCCRKGGEGSFSPSEIHG